jgi:DNA helicase-2/ATP-dependent DNA helicase PcrA
MKTKKENIDKSLLRHRLFIAAAGSGKTKLIIDEAMSKSKSNSDSKILITTFTEANEAEINKKFKNKKPKNIIVQTWFSFLIQHGVKPFQGMFHSSLQDYNISGLLFTQKASAQYLSEGPLKQSEETLKRYYFSEDKKIYSDKLSKFVVGGGKEYRKALNRKNFVKETIERLSKIFTDIYIDEAQDLAGNDLDFLKILFGSNINITLVADPRQTVYVTHHEAINKKYEYNLKGFIETECAETCSIDETRLNNNYRCHDSICKFSDKLYPEYKSTQGINNTTLSKDEHVGIFYIRQEQINKYLAKYKNTVQLGWCVNVDVNPDYQVYNFGNSKGLTFERVLIYPTINFIEYLKNKRKPQNLTPITRAKFYVAITRAVYSVTIVCDDDLSEHGISNGLS